MTPGRNIIVAHARGLMSIASHIEYELCSNELESRMFWAEIGRLIRHPGGRSRMYVRLFRSFDPIWVDLEVDAPLP